jgi:hypothetical protein
LTLITQKSIDTIFVLFYFGVMKNVTITVDEKVARWARIRAAERDTSLSRLIGEMLQEKMDQEENYQEAMDRYLSHSPSPLKPKKSKYPTRKELYAR